MFISSSSSRSLKKDFATMMAVLTVMALLPCLFEKHDLSRAHLENTDSSHPLVALGTKGGNLETEHFSLSFEGEITNMVDAEGKTLERVFDGATEFLNFTPSTRTRVNISTDPDILPPETIDLGFYGYVIPSSVSEGEPEMVLSLSPEWSIQSNDNNLDLREWMAAHEFVHVLRDYQTRDHNGSAYPSWLEEGLAGYFANEYLSASDEYLRWWIRNLLDNDELIDVDYLTQRTYFAYGEGYTIIKYIIDEYGRETFLSFLKAFEVWDGTKTTDSNLEVVFSTAFGTTLEEFNADWQQYLSEDFAVGFNREKIERVPGKVLVDSSGWDMPTSAKKGKLLWVTDQSGSLDIMLSNEDGSGKKWLILNDGYDGDAKLDGSATWVAFTSTRNGSYDIYKMTLDGKNLTQLTDDESVNIMGSWSSDGEEMAFTSNRNGTWDIFLMKNDGSDIRELVATESDEGSPSFSPDGSRLVFVSDADGNFDLYIADADGSNIRQLTSTPEDESFPSWSPDGKRIAYTSKREFSRKLCVIDAESGSARIVFDQPSHGSGFIGPAIGVLRFPVWSSETDTIYVAYGGQIFSLRLPSEVKDDTLWILVSIAIASVAVVILVLMLRKR
ncbi:MAG: peptidase MA family metallohydrolase [Thermoplasmata archaeon]